MKAPLSYKNRNKLLLLAFILLSWASYTLAFQETFQINKHIKVLERELATAADAPVKIKILQQKLHRLEGSLGSPDQEKEDKKEALLGIITNYCQNNKLIIRSVPQTLQNTKKEFLLETNVFTVEGDFNKILNLIYLLEQKEPVSKISSVKYFVKEDLKSQTKSLYANIYLQNIKKIHHEK